MDKLKPRLGFKHSVDFISPLPLETCLSRLKPEVDKQRKVWTRPSVQFDLYKVDPDTYQFEISKRVYRNSIRLKGLLKRQDSISTLVIGDASGSVMALAINGLLAIFIGLNFLGRPGGLVAISLLALSTLVVWGWTKMQENILVTALKDVLEYSP